MKSEDEALHISNPRLLTAAYYSLLAVIVTIVIDFSYDLIGLERMLPTYQAIILAVIIAAIFGALFGNKIVRSQNPYKRASFLAGFMMVLVALPVYDLIFLYLFKGYHPESFAGFHTKDFFNMYLFLLVYSFLLAGLWLAIAAGLAAMYLRGHLVYDILHSKNDVEAHRVRKTYEAPKENIKANNDKSKP